jgi:hypothetical protein
MYRESNDTPYICATRKTPLPIMSPGYHLKTSHYLTHAQYSNINTFPHPQRFVQIFMP